MDSELLDIFNKAFSQAADEINGDSDSFFSRQFKNHMEDIGLSASLIGESLDPREKTLLAFIRASSDTNMRVLMRMMINLKSAGFFDSL